MSRYVWFFLVKAEALEGGDLLTPGSEAMLQVCVPGVDLEPTLLELAQFLTAERYERRDLSIARRYDLENGDEEFPSAYLRGRYPWRGRGREGLHIVHDHQQGQRELPAREAELDGDRYWVARRGAAPSPGPPRI